MSKNSKVARRGWRAATVVSATVALVLVSGAGASVALAAVDSPSSVEATVKKVAILHSVTSPVGTILVDGRGRTVYQFAADSKGKSACDASCLVYWPAVIAPTTLPASVPGVSGRLGVLKRAGGVRQLTINGWPLYTYKGDTSKGAISGQGVNASGAKWWVVAPSGVRVTKMPASTSTQPAPSPSPSYPGGTY